MGLQAMLKKKKLKTKFVMFADGEVTSTDDNKNFLSIYKQLIDQNSYGD